MSIDSPLGHGPWPHVGVLAVVLNESPSCLPHSKSGRPDRVVRVFPRPSLAAGRSGCPHLRQGKWTTFWRRLTPLPPLSAERAVNLRFLNQPESGIAIAFDGRPQPDIVQTLLPRPRGLNSFTRARRWTFPKNACSRRCTWVADAPRSGRPHMGRITSTRS